MRFLIPLILLLSACSSPLFKLSTSQGNVIDDKKLAQVEIGMTPEQVRYLLGSPMVTDEFQPGRWDYVAYFRQGSGEEHQRTVSMIFAGGTLASMTDSQPPKASDEALDPSAPEFTDEQAVAAEHGTGPDDSGLPD